MQYIVVNIFHTPYIDSHPLSLIEKHHLRVKCLFLIVYQLMLTSPFKKSKAFKLISVAAFGNKNDAIVHLHVSQPQTPLT